MWKVVGAALGALATMTDAVASLLLRATVRLYVMQDVAEERARSN